MAAWSRKTLKKIKFLRFCRKTTPYGEIFKILLRKEASRHRSTCCVQMSWKLADGKSVKSCVAYLTKKNSSALQLSLLRVSHPKSARATPRECSQSTQDLIQIDSLSAELFPNASTPSKLACVSNIRLTPSFETNNHWSSIEGSQYLWPWVTIKVTLLTSTVWDFSKSYIPRKYSTCIFAVICLHASQKARVA